MVYDNMPNHVGSKPDVDKPLGMFIPSPNKTFLNKQAQEQFADMREQQELSPNTLVKKGVPQRRRPRLTMLTQGQKAKIAAKLVHSAMQEMGKTAALQACFYETFDKDRFMAGLIEDARYTRMMVNMKKVAKK